MYNCNYITLGLNHTLNGDSMKIFKISLLIVLTGISLGFKNVKAYNVNHIATSLISGSSSYLLAKGAHYLLIGNHNLSVSSIYQLLKETYKTKPREVFKLYLDDYCLDLTMNLYTGLSLSAISIALAISTFTSPENAISYAAGILAGKYSFDTIKKYFEINKLKQECEQKETVIA